MLERSHIHACLVGDSIVGRTLAAALREAGVAVDYGGSCLPALRRRLIADGNREPRTRWNVMFIVLDEATSRTLGNRLPALIDQLGIMTHMDALIGFASTGQPSPRDAALGLNLYANDVTGAIAILDSLTESRSTRPTSIASAVRYRNDAHDARRSRRGTDETNRFIGPRRSMEEPIQVHHCEEKWLEERCTDSQIVVTKGICDVEERMESPKCTHVARSAERRDVTLSGP